MPERNKAAINLRQENRSGVSAAEGKSDLQRIEKPGSVFGGSAEDKIPDGFEALEKMAAEKVRAVGLQGGAQVLAAQSAGGKLYCVTMRDFPSAEEAVSEGLLLWDTDSFLEELAEARDTGLDKLVCLWANGEIDVPSYDLRKRLCALNSANRDTKILLRSVGGYLVKTLSETMPKSITPPQAAGMELDAPQGAGD